MLQPIPRNMTGFLAPTITRSTNLRPQLNPLSNTRVPLTIFDQAAIDLHIPVLYAFRDPIPDNQAMIEGLLKALGHFPHLAGRLTSDNSCCPCITLNDAGIRLIEATVMAPLEQHLPFEPSSSELTKLYPPLQGVEELLQIQLTRFSCGGFIIGITCHHRVCDGHSMSTFLLAWAKLVRGCDVDPLPYHDRAAVSVPRIPPKCDFDHHAIEFRKETPRSSSSVHASLSSITNLVLHFSSDFIAELKSKATANDPSNRCSTFQCILAHMWKKVTIARELGSDEVTEVRVAVNGRARIRPCVPAEYFGNLVLWAYPRMRVGELLEASYADVVQVIREAIAVVDDAYFRSFIDFGELWKGKEEEQLVASAPGIGRSLSPGLEVDSWLSFRFHELDFGGGGPCAFLPPDLPVEGLMVFAPMSRERGGGVEVFLALFHEHVEGFKRTYHSSD